MHDIKFIKNKPEIFDRLQKKRNEKVKSSEILEIYNKYLSHINKIQELQKIRNNEYFLAYQLLSILLKHDKEVGEYHAFIGDIIFKRNNCDKTNIEITKQVMNR